jgi:hypothetical protein
MNKTKKPKLDAKALRLRVKELMLEGLSTLVIAELTGKPVSLITNLVSQEKAGRSY